MLLRLLYIIEYSWDFMNIHRIEKSGIGIGL